ncbi:OmpA family protein [Flavobacterium sp.]|uniref:OmpA family protein n=1 Tax=Flavobacterium sp. TaxID=239 RepID=UPI004047D599
MKTIISVMIMLMTCLSVHSQETVGEKVLKNSKDKTYQRGEQKSDETVDKALNKVEEGIGKLFKKKDKNKKNTTNQEDTQEIDETSESSNSTNKSSSTNSKTKTNVKSNSKFDFVAGEKQLAFDDFSTTEVGDFPLGWNTNSSAEIRTVNDDDTKWFSMTKDGFFLPEFIKDLPENCTIEFDVFTRYVSNNILVYSFYINAVNSPKKDLDNQYIQDGIYFGWRPVVGSASYFIYENGEEVSKNEGLKVNGFLTNDSENPIIARVSIWRQKSRLRVYVNEDKILDLPQAFDSKLKYNSFKFGAAYMNYSNGREHDDEFMISNIRYAVAGEDTRSKLITEGKFVTNGILFDVNSDNIKPESGSVLKEIAATLQENPTVRVKIIGHTDSDGADAANLALSKKRAAAVKIALSSFYGIDGARIETDGKGESQPLNKNANATEKATNRRVEFIKL